MLIYFLKSLLHNIGVILVGFAFAFVGTFLDTVFHLPDFQSSPLFILGWLLVAIGFAIRVWTTFHFYKHQMKVISLKPQKMLLTTGPYRFSRNPLYLGGNVFIFFGTDFILGSPGAIILTIIDIFFTDLMIRREEKQLEKAFGNQWRKYKKQVRRWI